MSTKRFSFAFLAFFILRFVFDAFLIPDFLKNLAGSSYGPLRDTGLDYFHLIAMLAHALLFVWLYSLVARGGGSWQLGLGYGVLASLLISLPNALHVYAMVDTPAMNVIWPVIWTVCTNAVGGIVIAVIIESGAPHNSTSPTAPATT